MASRALRIELTQHRPFARAHLEDERAPEKATESSAVTFPELVWSHFLRQQELRRSGDMHGAAEHEYRRRLDVFAAEQGRLLNAYWCTNEASSVALTEKRGSRVGRLLWRRHPTIRFHSVTDWETASVQEVAYLLHTCETLAIRVGEVLRGTSERIALQWILSTSARLLGFVDQTKGKPRPAQTARVVDRTRAELAQIEAYYNRAGEKTARLVYFSGMIVGVAALAALAVAGASLFWAFDSFHPHEPGTRDFFACYAMGAAGALVSVMSRMSSSSTGSFNIDYEVGRRSIHRVGSFRPFIGALFGLVLYFALRGGLLQIQPPSEGTSSYFYAALAFIAGFSERRARIMLGGAERLLGNGGDESGARRDTPKQRRGAGRPPHTTTS